MLKKYPKFSLLFALIFIVQLVVEFNQLASIDYIIKPLIVISLLFFLAYETKLKGRFHKRLFTGLCFALAGDLLLMFVWKEPAYFTYGLIAFLLCHVFYIAAFYLDFRSAPELDKRGARIAILFCAIVCTSFYFLIRPHLGAMKLPVMAYVLVISMMMMMAAFRNQRVNAGSFNLILAGAICFVVSDAILAYDKFVKGFDFSGFLVIATYMVAQYLIIAGGVTRKLVQQH